MKTNKFFLGAFAFLTMGALASCSNDEPAPNSGGEQQGDRYMAVRIMNPAEVSGRGLANVDDENPANFENPLPGAEQTIKPENARFYFFDDKQQPFILTQTTANGTVEKRNMVTPINLETKTSNDGNDAATTGILILGTPDAPFIGKLPKYVVFAANLPKTTFDDMANKAMNMLPNFDISKPTNDENHYDWKTFAMSTSVYAKEFNWSGDENGKTWHKIMATEIKEENIKGSIEEAQKNPLNIYVERIAAKVRVKGLQTYPALDKDSKIETFSYTNDDGTVVKEILYVNLTGWQVYKAYMKALVFKNITPSSNYFPGWNDPDRHRCYWAETPSVEDTYFAYGQASIYNDAYFTKGNYDPNNAETNTYIYPNTSITPAPTSDTDRTTNATAIIVRGQVCTEKVVDGVKTYKPITLVRWLGSYYTINAFKDFVLSILEKDRPDLTGLTRDNIQLVSTGYNKYKTVAKVNETGSFDISNFNDIDYWKDGITSYHVNIQHATAADGSPIYGVVRNHIYENVISGVIGLGVPGDDHTNPVDETESYLACTINVLNWRLISKNVVLQ